MDWIKEILEKHIGEEGKLDLTKAIDEVKTEFPKQAVPKSTFNEKLEDLKSANKLVDDLKKDNADVEDLQKKIDDYEADIETLNQERLTERKTYTLKEKLKTAGAKDVDYMIYKLGDLETDSEGNIIELDNKIKTLAEENEAMFNVPVEPTPEDKGGYKVLDNKLEDGEEPDANQIATQQFEDALGL